MSTNVSINENEAITTIIPDTRPAKTKKRHVVRWILLGTAVAVLIPVLVLGYLGFVPGLSGLLGATKPRDLGVRYTQADYQSYITKTKTSFKDFATAPLNPDRPGKKVVFADPLTAENMTFTQEEITAVINTVGWEWMPLTNAQVRFAAGNAVEISGNLNVRHVDDFVRFIGGVGYTTADVDKALSWAETFIGNAAVYIKGTAFATNDAVNIAVQQVKIGRFTPPTDISNKVIQVGTSNAVNNASNFSAGSVTFGEGMMQFSGTYPSTVYVRK